MNPCSKMGRCVLMFWLAAPSAGLAQPVLFQTPLSPRIANYDIDVRLEPEKRLLDARETLTWRNTSASPIAELQFHLYLNAFRNSKSTFMRESGGVSRGNRIDKDGWGFIEVERIAIRNGADLTGSMAFIQPDDGNADDKSVMRVLLPSSLPPGESIQLDIDFTAKLPQPPFARTGAKKEYFFVGQWFPKIGVYEENGWNCHQFHANSEFFADYGVYNVRMTVPAENLLGATGIEVEVKQNGDGTATHFYHAEDVHDFAWTTSPDFVEFTGEVQDVKIRVLMQKDHANQGERHVAAAKVAVSHFQDWYGDYPFPNLTVVDPRRGAGGSGGMEYPTLITAGTAYGIPEGIHSVEAVIIHEFGHNFWYHLLASNEFEESWMDEGINTYTEIQIMHDAYGPEGDLINFMGIKLNDLQQNRGQYAFFPDLDPMVRKAWEYYSSNSYGVNSYAKPGIVLTTLQNYLGREKMMEIMRTYVARWRFKHPKTQDFIDVVNEVSGQDMNWYFEQAFFSNAVLDYSVDVASTKPVEAGKGIDYDLTVVEAAAPADQAKKQAEKESSTGADTSSQSPADSTDVEKQEKKPVLYESKVNVRRLGSFKFPVELAVVFADGDTVIEHWDGRDLWKKYTYTRPAKMVSATVDPQRKVWLDVNFTNNSRLVETPMIGRNKLSARWLFWMQFLMDQPEFLNFLRQRAGAF